MKSFSQELLRFIVLYRQGKLSTNLFAVIFITIAIIICYPIFYFGYPLFHYWETIKIQVLIHLGIDLTPIEGDDGLPLIGETIDYKVNSDQFFKQKRKRFGNIFTTRLDLSDHTRGTSFFHLSKKIICLHELPSIYLPKQKMTRIGYYGSQIASFEVLKQYDQLYQALFRGSDYHRKIFRCENKIKQLTQTFLKRLIYESSFTFADKINQLCCEIMSTLFLGMKGLPVTLLHAMNRYLSQSYQQIRYLSDANADKDVIMNHILVAIFEEDRQYYDYNEQGKKSKSFVMDLLDAIDQVFIPVDGSNDNELEKIHVYFVFFVEYCYRQSVDLVRKALSKLLIDSNSKDDHSFYKRLQRLKEQEMIDIYHTMDGEDIARESTSSLPPSVTPVKFPVISKFRSFSEDVLYVSPMKTALGNHASAAETPQSAVRPPIVPLTPIADTIPDSIDDIIEGVIMEVKSEQSKQIHNSYAIYQCKERLMVSYSKEVKSTPAKIKSLSEMKEKEKEKEANPPTQRQHNFTIKPSQLILEIYDANIYHQEDPMSLPLLELSSDTIFDSLLRIFLTELLYDYEWQTGLPAASKTVGLGKHQCDRSESQGFSLIPDDALPVCCFRMKNLR